MDNIAYKELTKNAMDLGILLSEACKEFDTDAVFDFILPGYIKAAKKQTKITNTQTRY